MTVPQTLPGPVTPRGSWLPWATTFARNVGEAAQVRDLTAAMRDCVGRPEAPVFIDQEGGRVQRFRSPLAPDGECVVGDVYRHVVLGESGQIRPHHEIVPAAKDVHLWSPHSPINVQTAHVSREGEVLEQS